MKTIYYISAGKKVTLAQVSEGDTKALQKYKAMYPNREVFLEGSEHITKAFDPCAQWYAKERVFNAPDVDKIVIERTTPIKGRNKKGLYCVAIVENGEIVSVLQENISPNDTDKALERWGKSFNCQLMKQKGEYIKIGRAENLTAVEDINNKIKALKDKGLGVTMYQAKGEHWAKLQKLSTISQQALDIVNNVQPVVDKPVDNTAVWNIKALSNGKWFVYRSASSGRIFTSETEAKAYLAEKNI